MDNSQWVQALQNIAFDKELFKKMIDFFPFPMQVYTADGTLMMVNPAFIEEYGYDDFSTVLGRYNILQDPIAAKHGIAEHFKKAFAGKTVFASDVMVPLNVIRKIHGFPEKSGDLHLKEIYTFPLLNNDNSIICVVTFSITRFKYLERKEIKEAKAYMDSHWKDEFSIDKLSNQVHLSTAHFTRLFKKHVGSTPHNYYIDLKIKKLKEKLMDAAISIEEAFAACGLHYHGHYSNLFKEKTGFSPSEYRKMAQEQKPK